MPDTIIQDDLSDISSPDIEGDALLEQEEPDYDNSRGWHLYLVTKNKDLLDGCNRVLYECFLPNEIKTCKKIGAARKVMRKLVMSLYKEWEADPTKFITVSLNNTDWGTRGRYGKLKLSIGIIRKAIHRMEEKGLILFKPGDISLNPVGRKQTRIQATAKLIEMIHMTASQGDAIKAKIRGDKKRYLVDGIRPRTIMKDKDKKVIPVGRLPSEIKRGEELLERYQVILDSTKIINPLTGEEVQPHDKFQYRVFNRNSFDFNGRVHGGFWQGIGLHPLL